MLATMPVVLLDTVGPAVATPWVETYGPPLAGGMLVGLSAALLLGTLGRIAGISGILGNLIPLPRQNFALEVGWRLAFLAGLVTVGALAAFVYPETITSNPTARPLLLVLAGLLVGFGTRLGSGCTSGHGVCGTSRLSPRSIVATSTFVATGMLTVALMSLLRGQL